MSTVNLSYEDAMKIGHKLAHSMSSEQSRYYLNGFYLHGTPEGTLVAVSTDRHRLTRIKLHDIENAADFPGSIFPKEAVAQLKGMRLLKSQRPGALVSITVNDKEYSLVCEAGNKSFSGKLIDGTYPNYETAIPQDFSKYSNKYDSCAFDALYLGDVAEAVSYRPSLFAYKRGAAMRIHFERGNPAVITESDENVLYVLMPMRA